MTQNNLYMDDDDMRLNVEVQPLFLYELESCKNSAAESAFQAAQSEAAARTWKNNIIDYKTNLELFYAQASDGISNIYNSSASDLNAAKDSAIENLQTQKNSILNSLNSSLNTAINSIRTNAQSYVNQAQYYAEEAHRTVDNRVSKDHLNQSKGLETGSVSTDAEILADINKYAHSTFDISKFGVIANGSTVSNPTVPFSQNGLVITTDGIASGFSSSNYLTTTVYPSSIIHLRLKIGSTSPSGNQRVFGGGSGRLLLTSANTLNFWTDQYYSICTSSSGFFSNNDIADVTLDFKNRKAYFSNLTQGTNEIINITSDWDFSQGTLSIGRTVTGSIDFIGSIDLKQFSITVDGVPVFSGNKTGVDTIKADNWTIPSGVTSPTITDDGIMTTADSTHYLATPSAINLASANTWDIICSVKPNVSTLTQSCTIAHAASNFSLIYTLNTELKPYVFWNIGSSNLSLTANTTIVPNKKNYIKLHFEGSTMQFLSSLDKVNWTSIGSNPSPSHITTNNILSIGAGYSTTAITQGELEFDLNDYEIYVDGDLVYQPLLRIPYTESKTGSKVVDAVYRDRVNDMYERFGHAPYYTLSDTDFTLPMGDIYGMIENLRQLIIERTS